MLNKIKSSNTNCSTKYTEGEITHKTSYIKKIGINHQLYWMLIPAILYIVIFQYGSMYGIQLAFKDYFVPKGITGSPWVGLKHFQRLFASPQLIPILLNTLGLSIYTLVVSFPMPIILALLINSLPGKRFKSLVQNVTYAPHFISTVVMVAMLGIFLSPRSGIINNVIQALGGDPVHFMAIPEYFKSIYVFSGVWQHTGWSAVIYIAALTSISPELHEAAMVDGATKLQRIRHIDIPGIIPTMVTLLILNLGSIMSVGFEKVFLMQNSLTLSASETIQTYVYKMGMIQSDFGYSTAVGLFNSIINFIMLILANKIAKKVTDVGLW